MSGRWEPKCGEDYYFIDAVGVVSDYVWRGTSLDRLYYESGNCFKTEAKAKATAEKVKALLLNLHEPAAKCNQLPKLTTEVFDRPDCPKWAKYAAVDRDGIGRVFESKPMTEVDGWYSFSIEKQAGGGKYDASDWQNSLIERPVKKTKLPDWCKVGEWVWAIAFNAYFKVDKVDGLFIYGTAFPGSEYSVAINNVRQARLRPFNAEEMRGMVGKVINNPCSSRLVTAYNEGDCIKILTSIGWYTADDLMTSDYTIDGKPCGVLEHLNENGEWVE